MLFLETNPIIFNGRFYLFLQNQQSDQVGNRHKGDGDQRQIPDNSRIGKGSQKKPQYKDNPIDHYIFSSNQISNAPVTTCCTPKVANMALEMLLT